MDTTNQLYYKLNTPCFIFDCNDFIRNITEFKKALAISNRQCILGYSVKTNSLPYMLSMAKNFGCFAEVVSYDEYDLAKKCGYEINRIIYNGPLKTKETFLEAIKGNAIVNIETKRELEWLKELPKNKIFNIGIRLNINLSKISPKDADGENDYSRFGFSDETNELRNTIEVLNSIHQVKLVGLHVHRTTHTRSVEFYQNLVNFTISVAKKYKINLDYLDIGGGYFGLFQNNPSYYDYVQSINKTCIENGYSNLKLIFEPGNAIHASAFKFLSSIIDSKQIEPNIYCITTDGSRNDIDPFFRKTSYLLDFIYKSKECVIIDKQIIAGCTCLEFDKITELRYKQQLKVGDKLLFNNVGAYTMCLSPMFIRYLPRVYAIYNGECSIIREAYTSNEYLINNKLY